MGREFEPLGGHKRTHLQEIVDASLFIYVYGICTYAHKEKRTILEEKGQEPNGMERGDYIGGSYRPTGVIGRTGKEERKEERTEQDSIEKKRNRKTIVDIRHTGTWLSTKRTYF